jgi:hypothetical protein
MHRSRIEAKRNVSIAVIRKSYQDFFTAEPLHRLASLFMGRGNFVGAGCGARFSGGHGMNTVGTRERPRLISAQGYAEEDTTCS